MTIERPPRQHGSEAIIGDARVRYEYLESPGPGAAGSTVPVVRDAGDGSAPGTDSQRDEGRYRYAAEHLRDLLTRLDLLLQRELLRRGLRASTDYLSFAAITEDEVMGLLRESGRAKELGQPTSEEQAISRALEGIEQRTARRTARTLAEGYRLPLVDLAERFLLSPPEQDVLVLCAAAELDRRYERVFGYLHDDMSRKLPSAGLAVAVFSPGSGTELAARTVFAPQGPLRRHRLIELTTDGTSAPRLARALRLDERILSFLLGEEGFDARIADAIDPPRGPIDSAAARPQDPPQMARLLQMASGWAKGGPQGPKLLIYLHGAPGAGAEDLAARAAEELGLALLSVDLTALPPAISDLPEGLLLVFREALLRQAALFLQGIEPVLEADASGRARRALERCTLEMGGLVFVSGRTPWRWPLPRPPLVLRSLALRPSGLVEQLQTWRGLIGTRADSTDLIDDRALQRLVSRHPLPIGAIAEAWRSACDLADLRGPEAPISIDDLEQACRSRAAPPMSGLTRVIEPRHGWEDLVLPTPQLEQLKAICSQAASQATVYGVWGFERKLSLGKGLSALFSGPPGTGKTMAAEVIAADLALPLLKIDLSQVVSKYIGETEKNLRALFDQAAAAHAILFFDEADALLGKRSAISDAHDRYANTEVAYLLQKMEEFEGITILATNLRQNMDEAFTRRMRFIVDFPFPEEDERLRIWQGVWPAEVPLDDGLDLARLAREFRLSGGSIRNIALAGAFLAAADGSAVRLDHVLRETRRELQKMGRLVNETEERFRV